MARLTTHVLDQTQGIPGSNILVELFQLDSDGARVHLTTATTNEDGRAAPFLLDDENAPAGLYELVFYVGDYFRESSSLPLSEPAFLEQVVIRFGLHPQGGHYHIPLLVSPYGYSTYRGS